MIDTLLPILYLYSYEIIISHIESLAYYPININFIKIEFIFQRNKLSRLIKLN